MGIEGENITIEITTRETSTLQHIPNQSENNYVRSRHVSNTNANNDMTTTPYPVLQREKTTDDFKTSNIEPLNIAESPNNLDANINPNLNEKESEKETKSVRVKKYIILSILLMANLINYMDRYTIAGVLDDVQKYYSINNAQVGLLQTSFIISYMLFSPIFGYLGDRYNRKWAMIGGIFFWSIVTFIGSFVPSDRFSLFVFLRTMVGVGEASYSTIAPTIIADMFSHRMRTKALSIFYFAIPVGSGLGYIIGSKVAQVMGAWYWALRVTPLLGIICTFLVAFLVTEPKRGESDGGFHLKNTSFASDLLYLLKHKSFMLSTLGFTCVAFVAGALSLWAPLYVYRSARLENPDVSMSSMSFIFGVITCVAGLLGVLGGYWAAGKFRPYSSGADALVCAFGLIAGAPFLYLALVMSRGNIIVVWLLILLAVTMISLNWALVTDILLYTVIPTRRSAGEAFQILLSHALGDAGSPYLVGLISDGIESSYGQHDQVVQYFSLQYAMFMTCFVCVLGGAFFLATALYVQGDKEKADRIIRTSTLDKNVNNNGPDQLLQPMTANRYDQLLTNENGHVAIRGDSSSNQETESIGGGGNIVPNESQSQLIDERRSDDSGDYRTPM